MKQKFGIIAALMHDPPILILYEPISGLDPLVQNIFIQLIAEEKARGKTILLSSHMFEEVERTCDHIGIICQSRMVAIDSVDALLSRHLRTYTVQLDTPELAQNFVVDFDGHCDGTNVTVISRQNLESISLNYYEGGPDNERNTLEKRKRQS